MSVSISALKLEDTEGDNSFANLANDTWLKMTERTQEVATWNGFHDRIVYTPNDLRAIARANPDHAEWLNDLADNWGGGVLS